MPGTGSTLVAGAVFGLALAAPPGPMNAVIAEESVLRGWLAGFTAGLGAMTADFVFLLLSLAGVVAGAPNREHAIALLEFLTTAEAQKVFAGANYEYPVVESVELPEVLESFGDFKEDSLNAAELGNYNREAVKVMDRADWR